MRSLRDRVCAIISIAGGCAYPILAPECADSERKKRIAARDVRR
jgi:hypothetical protein